VEGVESTEGGAVSKKEKGKRAGKGGGAKADAERKEEEAAKKLATVEDPLAETVKPLELLQTHALDRLETHYLALEVYMRKSAWLLALRAVKRMHALCPLDPLTHVCTVRLFHEVATRPTDTSYAGEVVKKVLDAEAATLLRGLSLKVFNEEFLKQGGSTLAHAAAAAEAMLLLDPADKERALALVMKATDCSCQKQCISVHKLLLENFKDEAAAAKWKNLCAAKFPLSLTFKHRSPTTDWGGGEKEAEGRGGLSTECEELAGLAGRVELAELAEPAEPAYA
ncbi:N-alpha-acetyltransferase 16, NatA auxiliary subunit, partial [Cymbomonas tetramitiformis]